LRRDTPCGLPPSRRMDCRGTKCAKRTQFQGEFQVRGFQCQEGQGYGWGFTLPTLHFKLVRRPFVQNEPNWEDQFAQNEANSRPAAPREHLMVRNEPNFRRCRVERGPRGGRHAAIMQNEPNFGRSLKFEVSSVKREKPAVGSSSLPTSNSQRNAGCPPARTGPRAGFDLEGAAAGRIMRPGPDVQGGRTAALWA